jgi:hypothetical protein
LKFFKIDFYQVSLSHEGCLSILPSVVYRTFGSECETHGVTGCRRFFFNKGCRG